MSVLDRALEIRAASESPLQIAARMRQEAEDRRVENAGITSQATLDAVNAATKRRDLKDRENLTPLYRQWSAAPAGAAGDAQREQARQGIGAVDPEKAQAMQKTQLEILQKIDAMSDKKRERAREAAAQNAARAQWAKEQGPDTWAKLYPDTPYEQADVIIGKGKVVNGIFDFYETNKSQKKSMVQAETEFYADTLGISMTEAIEYARSKNDAELRTRIMNTLAQQGFEGPELDAELERRFTLVKRLKAQQKPGADAAVDTEDPFGFGQ